MTQELSNWLRHEGASCQKHLEAADALERMTKELATLKHTHNSLIEALQGEQEWSDTLIAERDEAQDSLMVALLRIKEFEKDAARIDWIECRAMNGCIETARSIMKTGYEFGIRTETESTVFVKSGTLRNAIDAAIAKEQA